jgi:gas vesicle protein
MKHYHVNTKEFVVGAAIGSLLGSVTALLIAPQSGRRLRRDISDACSSLNDKTQDFTRKGRSFAKNFGNQSSDWFGTASKCIKSLKGWTSEEEEEEACTKDFMIGGLAGGFLGAIAGLLLAPKSGEELRQDIMDTYEDVSDKTEDMANDITRKGKAFAKKARKKANKWLDMAHHLVDDVTERTQDSSDELFEKAKGLFRNHRMHEVIDWASLGYRLWEGLKSKR